MDLAAHLRELQVRAGDPSIRVMERLIARQGRQHPMARSTIQEKISGRSPVNLLQVLSIVEALAEHARLNGIPLAQQEIDQSAWRERVTASAASSTVLASGRGFSAPPQRCEIEWNVEPLKQAHMFDLVAIVDEPKGVEVADWLPRVIRGMVQAEMAFGEFLESAAKDSPRGVVKTVSSLQAEFPPDEPEPWGGQPDPWYVSDNERTVGTLLMHAARVHGAVASPAIVAGLRRANVGYHVDGYLAGVGSWHLSVNIEAAVNHLRAAALGKDAKKLLGFVGKKRMAKRLLEVVKHFEQLGKEMDVKRILRGVADDDCYRLGDVYKAFRVAGVPEEMLLELVRGVPYGRHSEYAQTLQEAGYQDDLVDLLIKMKDEPPF